MQFLKALDEGEELIVVDNTNSCLWEYERFLVLGGMYGYECIIQEIPCESRDKMWKFYQRNSHNTPHDVILFMWRRWESDHRAVFVN